MLSDLSSVTRCCHSARSLLEAVELLAQLGELLVEVLLGPQPMIAGVGVDAEIADDQRAADIEAERGEERSQLSPGDHAGKMR